MKKFKGFLTESTLPIVFLGIGKHNQLNEWMWENSRDTKEDVEKNAQVISDQNEKESERFKNTELTQLKSKLGEHYGPYYYNLLSSSRNAIQAYVSQSRGLNRMLVRHHQQNLQISNPNHFSEALKDHETHMNVRRSDLEDEDIANHRAFYDRIRHIDNSLELAPDAPHNFHVYTGVGSGFNIEHLRQQGHSLLHLPAYTSTSLDPGVARFFAREKEIESNDEKKRLPEIVRIHIPSGSPHGAYLHNNRAESEFLLKRKTNIRLIGQPRYTVKEEFHGPRIFRLHDAEIVE